MLITSGGTMFRDVALLDLVVAETALTQKGCEIPPNLGALVDKVAEAAQHIPALSYELITMVNPSHDIRCFNIEEIRRSEKCFYKMHATIEGYFSEEIALMFRLVDTLSDVNIHQGELHAKDIGQRFDSILRILEAFRTKVPREHFMTNIRPFLMTNTKRRLLGPSGAFTGSIPTIKILLGGEQLDSNFFSGIKSHLKYYPRQHQEMLLRAIKLSTERRTLSRLTNGTPAMRSYAQKIEDFLTRFLEAHFSLVASIIGEDIFDADTGTAGSSTRSYLEHGLKQIPHLQ